MIKPEQEVFVQFSNESKQRILHPATAKTISGQEITLIPTNLNLQLETDQNIRVFHQARDFMQQTATVLTIAEEDGDGTVTVELTSEPVSAENRSYYRVSTVFANLSATVGTEKSCKLVDISIMGFAIIATKQYAIGEILDTELEFDGLIYPGLTCVQSVRDLGAGRIRYGLLPLASDTHGTRMFAGMQQMTTAIQRLQLKRLSGAV